MHVPDLTEIDLGAGYPSKPGERPRVIRIEADDGFTYDHRVRPSDPLPHRGGAITLGDKRYVVREIRREADVLVALTYRGRSRSLRSHSLSKRKKRG